ncbi:hypothetical protein [Deinococcus sp. Marseille-Q6407]|uniref:hypothetical protein n=1 Tax=Deinococcus sp. Marseille-Q6407 TaxID=2969223 RepID=UPI0021C133BE|nr:hypothetical protein [Deinococcus sp. Marseille-Q6407]
MVSGYLAEVARRHGWTWHPEPGDLYQLRAVDRFGASLGWVLLSSNIAAVAAAPCQPYVTPWPLLGAGLLDTGPLWDALSASGVLVLPDPAWLTADLTSSERARLLASAAGNGWEAKAVQKERPGTRAEVLFNTWD